MSDILDLAVQRFQSCQRALDFRLSDSVFSVYDLAMEVGQLDCVGVDEADGMEAGTREAQGSW